MDHGSLDSDQGGERDIAEPIELSRETRLERFLQLEHGLCGNVDTVEALDILSRFNASHFRNTGTEQARYSIPANPRRDDDIRLAAFIARAQKAFRLVQRMRAFIHNDPGVAISDTAEFEAIDGEIAALGLFEAIDGEIAALGLETEVD